MESFALSRSNVAEQRCLIVKLSSSSGEIFEVAEAVALQSGLLKNVMEDMGITDSPIPLPNVSSDVLQQVLQHCVNQTSNIAEDYDGCPVLNANKSVQNKIVGKEKLKDLFNLIMAANYMQVETLLHQLYQKIAMMIAKGTFGEMKQIFNSGNDFARGGEEHIIGPNKIQILASFIRSLPKELQFEIKETCAVHYKCPISRNLLFMYLVGKPDINCRINDALH